MANKAQEIVAEIGVIEGKLVQFVQDLAPYCKGDIVKLDSEAEKYVAARVKALRLEGDVFTSKVKAAAAHTEGGNSVVVGAAQAPEVAAVVDQPTTVHGGTVINEQNAPSNLKPSDAEIKDRTENPKNPRGDSSVADATPAVKA